MLMSKQDQGGTIVHGFRRGESYLRVLGGMQRRRFHMERLEPRRADGGPDHEQLFASRRGERGCVGHSK